MSRKCVQCGSEIGQQEGYENCKRKKCQEKEKADIEAYSANFKQS